MPAPAHKTDRAKPSIAGRCLRSWVVLLAVAVTALVVDLASKHWAFETVAGAPVHVDREQVLAYSRENPALINRLIPAHEPVVVVPYALEFTLVLNPGAVFGVGPGQRGLFIAFTGVAMTVAVIAFAFWTRPKAYLTHAAIGLLIGGGIGNLYDRMVYACVRDFLHPLAGVKFPFGITVLDDTGQVWPYVSNVADLFLLIGIGIIVFRSFTSGKHDPKSTGSDTQTKDAPAQATPSDAD